MENWVELLKRLPSLFAGLFLFSTGLVMNLNSGLGMNPWGVLSVGIARQTHITFGQATQVVGLIVLVVGWALGFAPGLGTFANMYFIGFFIDGLTEWNMLTAPANLVAKYVMLLLSIVLIGIASFFYLRVQLGAGPRDGFMMGLVKRLDYPVSWIRATIEIIVLIIGFLLGGPVGVGTMVTAITHGISVQLAFKFGKYDKNSEHVNILNLARYLSGKGNLPKISLRTRK